MKMKQRSNIMCQPISLCWP